MKRSRQILRMSIGGGVCGSFLGIFVGGLLGAFYGCLVGDVSLGLDNAMLGGVLGCLAGHLYGAWVACLDDSAFPVPGQAVAKISLANDPAAEGWPRSKAASATANINNR